MSFIPSEPVIYLSKWAFSWLVEELNTPALRVLSKMLLHLKWGNVIDIKQADLAPQLKSDKQYVYKGKTALLKRRVIFEGELLVGHKCYILNPNLAWYGKKNARFAMAQLTNHVCDFSSPPFRTLEGGDIINLITGELIDDS